MRDIIKKTSCNYWYYEEGNESLQDFKKLMWNLIIKWNYKGVIEKYVLIVDFP